MCGEVVAAPLSLQDTVYPILRKKSLHFCEKSKKFLKLCTAVRKKYKMKRLRRKTNPLSLAALASSPKGAPLGVAVKFPATAKSRPLGEGGLPRSGKTEGVTPPHSHPFFICSACSFPCST